MKKYLDNYSGEQPYELASYWSSNYCNTNYCIRPTYYFYSKKSWFI